MPTIRRNWTKRIEQIRAAAKFCRAYDSSTGHMITVDPARAFEAWHATPRATLSEDTPGQKWRVHIHSNRFYVLTATDPTLNVQDHAQRASTAALAAAPRGASAPALSPADEAALMDAAAYTQDAPGGGKHAAAAATKAINGKIATGALGRDQLTRALPGITAAVTAKAVRDLREQGLTHEQVRMRLERMKAEAQAAGSADRAMVADAMIATHAGIVADEDQARLTKEPAGNHGGNGPTDQGSTAGNTAEAHRLERCRLSEERYRPVAVRVYVSPITGGAALRWLDGEGRDCPNLWDPVPLEGCHAHAMRDEVLNAAGLVLAKRGFNYARGAYWEPVTDTGQQDAKRPDTAKVAIVPTHAYLKLQARRFGPVPDLPDVPGVTFETTQRGQWRATVADGRTFLLTWRPSLDGDRWTVWGGEQHSQLIRSTSSMSKALFVLRHPVHARP